MKHCVESILESSPNKILPAFDDFRNAVSAALEDALDIPPFSESEAMVIAHTILGILTARQTAVPVTLSEKTIPQSGDTLRHPALSHPPSSSRARTMTSIGTKNEQATRRSEKFPLMDLDGHSILPSILSYLPFEDLNSLAICCQRLRELRSAPSLDQTRTGVLKFREDLLGNGWNRLIDVITNRNLRQVFRGNRTNLRLQGFVKALNDETISPRLPREEWCLPEVKSLALTHEQKHDNPFRRISQAFSTEFLGFVLPNVQTLDVSHAGNFITVQNLASTFPNLRAISAMYSELRILPDGDTLRNWDSLRELYLEGNSLSLLCPTSSIQYGLPPNLERLDIRHVTDLFHDGIPAKDLIGILRHTTSLRWLRCDGSSEEISALRIARPDVTIVT